MDPCGHILGFLDWFSHLLGDIIHISGFGGEDAGVM
jgi:hypothetical protein